MTLLRKTMKVDNDYTGQVDKYGVIYRNFDLPRSGKAALGEFMQALLSVNGQTTCQSQLGTWPPNKQGHISTFFRLRFRSTDHLDKFHALGYTTTEIKKITIPTPLGDS